MRVIGLTGGIGSGKSTVARMFAALGARVVDADAVARDIVEPGQPALDDIVAAFGPGIIQADGRLDRKRLASIVFRDPTARSTLDAITHPRIRDLLHAAVEARRAEPGLLVLDIPLLFESAPNPDLEAVVVVWVDQATQLRRLVERDGLSPSEATERLSAQMPLDKKRAMADAVIDNRGSEADTRRQVEIVYRRYIEAGNEGAGAGGSAGSNSGG